MKDTELNDTIKQAEKEFTDSAQLCDIKKCCVLSLKIQNMINSECNPTEKTIVLNTLQQVNMFHDFVQMLDKGGYIKKK